MTTTFYLLRDEAPLPHPVTKQSSDTTTHDYATLYASYARPGLLSTTAGSQPTFIYKGYAEPGYPHYTHLGTFVSDPLPAQVLSGTVTIDLCVLESISDLNIFPRVTIYTWRADNTYGTEILALTTSGTGVSGLNKTTYYTTEAIESVVLASGDKIVIEIETYDNNTVNVPQTLYYEGLKFGGTGTNDYSYITFSADIVTAFSPGVVEGEHVKTIDVNIFDQSMNLIGVIDDYEWFTWTRNWYVPDTWELMINRYKPNADLILSCRSLSGTTWEYGGFIGITTSLGRRIGMIERIELPLDSTGKISEQYRVSGRGVEGILGTRMAKFGTDSGTGYDTQSTYAETAMRHYVQVNCADESGTAPLASFTASPSSGADPLYVDFINTSTGTSPLTYSWDYTDDDEEDSTDQSPTDISYNTAGTYTCRLTVTNAYGSSSTTRTITVSEAEGAPEAAFTAGGTSGTNPLSVTFIDQSTNTPTSWAWNFGDSSASTSQNPTHEYTSTGTFTVSLTATNALGSDTETKTGYITVTTSSGIPEYGAPTVLNGYALGGSYYGGGTQYPAYTAGVAGGDYDGSTISTRSALISALEDAESPAVIYISPTADISMNEAGDENLVIPAGVTLASNRGVGGSAGGKIWADKEGSGWNIPLFLTGGNNVRITGLRLWGECYTEDAEHPAGESGNWEEYYRVGVRNTEYTGFVVDNCDLKGWAYACIYNWNTPLVGQAHIHHNYIHHCWNKHEGYGVNTRGGYTLIEGNVFDCNRHDITGEGLTGECYVCRYNYFTDTEFQTVGMSHVDMHENEDLSNDTAGARMDIYNNTWAGGSSAAIHIRTEPTVGCYVHHNVIDCIPDDEGWTNDDHAPIYQTCPCGNMYVTYNYWLDTLVTDDTDILWLQGA